MKTKGKTTLSLALAGILLCAGLQAQDKHTVRGTVRDDGGEALAGAIVVVKGEGETVKATATADAGGRWSIDCQANDVLSFHFLGFQTVDEPVRGRAEINVTLHPDASSCLDAVVVIGYGAVRKGDLTGSVANVKMSDLRDVPSPSLDQALQGHVAGVEITSTDGDPSSSSVIRIRGTRSITASNDPLLVVDGVMDAISSLDEINPNDVESISVLKDASSTAIYGARGANGVILITTKGTSDSSGLQTFSVNFRAQGGVSTLPKKLDIMNATEYALYRDEYMQYSGTSASMNAASPVSELSVKDPYSKGAGTDWLGEVSRVAPYQDYTLSCNGFMGKQKFYASLSYNNNRGIIKNSGVENYTASLNVTNTVLKWLTLNANLRYQFRHSDNNVTAIGGTGIYYAAMYISPLINPSQSYNPLYNAGTRVNNPVVRLNENIDNVDRSMMTIAFSTTAKATQHLTYRNKFSYFYFDREWHWFWPSTLPAKEEGEGAETRRQDYGEQTFYAENTLTYSRNFGKHHADFMLGQTAYRFRSSSFNLYGKGYMVDAVKWNNMNAVTDKETYQASTSLTEKLKLAYFGRVNYNYRSKYYLTLTGRFDGASNFAANHKWGFFPSAALKWTISNEPFLSGASAIDDLSLKLSAGRSGNDLNTAYRSLARMDSTTSGYLFGGSQPVAYYQARIASPDLTWEKTDLYNLALEGSFLNTRVTFTLEGYLSKTHDLLLTVQTPQHTGYSTKYGNVGSTTTKGVELTLNTRNIVKRSFTWTSALTLSHSRSVVDDIGSESYVSALNSPEGGYMMAGYKEGYPLNSFWGFQYAGVWHNQEEVERNKVTRAYANVSSSTSLGVPIYVDVNHDGSLDSDDLCYLGSGDPWLSGGLQNSFRFKGFNVGIFFTYSLGGKVYNYAEYYMAGSRRTNQYRYMLNAWHPVKNPTSDYPRAGVLDGSNVPSSFMIHDASYLRLKNASVAYTFTMKSKVLREITLTASGENLLLFSKYNGFDPDVSTNGIQRLDYSSYPKARRVVMSVQFKY